MFPEPGPAVFWELLFVGAAGQQRVNNTFSDYTENEFVALLQRIISHDGTEPEVDKLVFHFDPVVGLHP
ncbi:bacteriocin immunity protein [Pseudomonas sp. 43A]|jgi:hypothetical protein|uniref:bacteriocin immunity protein n=1 Tax=unclassified Pseudomonas TaxID=196821 RepID=UPI0015874CC1|nr:MULTISPECIES: bacteriocin immunity protein [unclassified Pseudomonas]QKV66597.1 bacteriocin immunity protein [Pseudomonas sp. 43A]QMW10950.1 bacteriocin immunity protein [Pseudomonas sp. 29A]